MEHSVDPKVVGARLQGKLKVREAEALVGLLRVHDNSEALPQHHRQLAVEAFQQGKIG